MTFRSLLLVTLCFLSLSKLATAQHEKPLILAHRGGAYEYEENTMEGFRACYDRGLRGFETDVRMTKDGILVILHDDTLNRTHNATGSVEHMTAAELKEVTTKKGQKMLFLDELLHYLADKPGMYVELEMKTSNKELYPDARIEEYCRKLYDAAQAKKPATSQYLFTSFDERPLVAIRALDAKTPMAIIASKPLTEEFIQRAERLEATHIACQLKGTSRAAVEEAHKKGYFVNCWPGRAVEDYYLAIGLGIDVHCTDIPVAIQSTKEKLP